jgi:uncharacterized protein YlaI
MGDEFSPKETFFCPLCERRLKRNMLSRARLKNVARLDQRLCTQCESFLNEGLDFLKERLAQKKFTFVPPMESDIPFPLISAKGSLPLEQGDAEASLKEDAVLRSRPQPRTASTVEKERFYYHSLSVERQIEGFIKGLEAAGINRENLNGSTETAINNLLQIAQTLAGQRRTVQSESVSRADIRRMGRHISDTALMVNEYIEAVSEESLEP